VCLTLTQFLNPAFIILRVVMGQSYVSAPSGAASSPLQFSSRNILSNQWQMDNAEQDSGIFPTKPTAAHDETIEMSVRCDTIHHTA
jgi:hypothetical protein